MSADELGPSGEGTAAPSGESFRQRVARRAEENARTANNVRFYDDGTAEVLPNLFGGHAKPRSRVVDAVWLDGRARKSVAGRGLAALATGGLSLAASNTAGQVSVTVVTQGWTYTVSSKQNLDKLLALAVQARAAAARTTMVDGNVRRIPQGEVPEG